MRAIALIQAPAVSLGGPADARAGSLSRCERRLLRVGHKGADLIEPGNTPASFDAALAHGVDMIELDVLPERSGGRLILAHDYGDAGRRRPFSLEDGLAHLASPPFASIGFIVDLKLPGYELRVLDALNEHGLLERSIVSSQFRESLLRIRATGSRVRLGWSVPRARRDYTRSPLLAGPAYAALRLMRIVLPSEGRLRDSHRFLRRDRRALAARVAATGRGRRAGGWRALRLDGGRRLAHPRARGARRDRRDHERSSPVSEP